MTSDDTSKIKAALMKRYEHVDEEVRKYWDKKIDEELKRRNKKNAIAPDPKSGPKGRALGQQDIGDISYATPWQAIVRDQLGISVPIGTYYKCPVCGYAYALDMPPERCLRCGAKSYLHMKNIVNLKF